MGQNPMKDRRLELDAILKGLCPNVYFEPPSSVKMTYPAIRYRRSNLESLHADNLPYLVDAVYEVIVIDRDPDSAIAYAVSQLPLTRHNRHYYAENLSHDSFTIYH